MTKQQRARLEALAAITVETAPEDCAVRGSFATGDDAADTALEDEILARLEYDEWAWCTVKVTARYADFEGTDYLGCCSYADEKDFCQPGGYYDDMKAQALDDLADSIDRANEALLSLDEAP